MSQPANLVALFHERILRDERAGRVLERAEDLDGDVVDPAELDGPRLHHLRALVGELEHLLVADDLQLPRAGDDAGVGSVDAANVGENLASRGVEAGGKGDGSGVGAAAAEGRGLVLVGLAGGQALEAGDDHDLAVVELIPGSMAAMRALP